MFNPKQIIKKMKARIIVLMLVAGLLMGSNQANAQIGSFLKDKAKDALNKSTKKDTKKETKEETEQTQKQQTPTNPMGNMMQKKMLGMMGLNNVKYEMKYDFTSSMKMEMQATDSLGKKSDKILYTSSFDKNSKNFAMEFEGTDQESKEKQKSLMIFDYKNWAMLILGGKSGEKSGIAMQMAKDSTVEKPTQETQQDQKDLSEANMYYKATGRTKTIAGYNCKEYTYENTKGKGEIWATNDVAFDYSSAYGQMGGMQTMATGGTAYGMGMVMEMHFSDKDSQAKSDLWVIEVKPTNPQSIDLTGYQIIGMGGAQNQSQGQTKEKGKNKK